MFFQDGERETYKICCIKPHTVHREWPVLIKLRSQISPNEIFLRAHVRLTCAGTRICKKLTEAM